MMYLSKIALSIASLQMTVGNPLYLYYLTFIKSLPLYHDKSSSWRVHGIPHLPTHLCMSLLSRQGKSRWSILTWPWSKFWESDSLWTSNFSHIYHIYIIIYMAVCQNLVPLVNIKIAGKWMSIPLKMVSIGIDPYPYHIYIHSHI